MDFQQIMEDSIKSSSFIKFKKDELKNLKEPVENKKITLFIGILVYCCFWSILCM